MIYYTKSSIQLNTIIEFPGITASVDLPYFI